VPKTLSQQFITPRDLAVGNDTYIDANAEIDSVISNTQLRLINLSGDNTQLRLINLSGDNILYGGFSPNAPARGPIWNAGAALGEDGPNGDQPYASNVGIYNLNDPSQSTGPTYWWPPNAQILKNVGGNFVPTGLRVKSVNYTSGSPYGSDAIIETFDDITGSGLTSGDQIAFTSGRWLVEAPNNVGQLFTFPQFPRLPMDLRLPFTSTTTGTENTQQELCDLVENASPAKNNGNDCSFYQQPTLIENVPVSNPATGTGTANFMGFGFMLAPGTDGAGTVDGCNENCVENQ